MRSVTTAAILLCLVAARLNGAPKPPVVVSEDEATFTLANGILAAQVAKRSGDLLSLKYRDLEMLNVVPRRQAGYWSHNTARGQHAWHVTIDPKSSGGERAEVSVQGLYDGTPLGSGPGGSVAADIEVRYALSRGNSGLYAYSVFTHKANYPASSVGEARFCAKLNDHLFDWMTVDANRNMKMITAYDWNHGTVMNFKEARRMNSGLYNGQVEHKYDYAANQFEVRAWGWSSTARKIGLWFINPSVEYLSGGPPKVELSAHRDATFGDDPNAPAPPTLLNYWRSSHYGGSVCSIAQTDAWTKVIGPFLIYCNAGADHDGLWKDALAKAAKESAVWPYEWVSGVDYPQKAQRSIVAGRLVLDDPQAPSNRLPHLLVGLAAPDYMPTRVFRGPGGFGGGARTSENATNSFGTNILFGALGSGTNLSGFTNQPFGRRARFGGIFGPRTVDWQNDAKHYEFWVRGDAKGRFAIPNVRPGTYTLHAFADGVLGEFILTNVTVAASQVLKLGQLQWRPVRYGKQLWDIGIPNRSGAEFFKGDQYYHWGWYLQYAELFPNDVSYVIGQSQFGRDWFFEQVPHNLDPANTTGEGEGRSTTWSIIFDLPVAPVGRATLRLALCAFDTRNLTVSVNDQPISSVTGLLPSLSVLRDGISGCWAERDLIFDAALMRAGQNFVKLTVPAGPLTSGVIYDYLRLELDNSSVSPKPGN
jgi:rhamnogalacturonan endolyase